MRTRIDERKVKVNLWQPVLELVGVVYALRHACGCC
jgi:hypothetical protein